ncbi:hypothetical protein HYH02_011775 [Chlamydomonas schloesseri]|uniref:Uncharacterized protein n=1 Tax=Chlamydomonas schloesseri TaxID=2026947 RepID=A0A835TAT0_9CHLO|nr:hypothetical protein HYH02_011775 [Chlamydomonas schloesseri]|eukprot:KAG2435480.1 hypothetical protein HYH02_011775 [Chlamydomonas schloesseri]
MRVLSSARPQGQLHHFSNGVGAELVGAVPVPLATLKKYLPEGYIPSPPPGAPEGFGALTQASVRYATSALDGGADAGELINTFWLVAVDPPPWAQTLLGLEGARAPLQAYVLEVHTNSKVFYHAMLDAGFPIKFRAGITFSELSGGGLAVTTPGVVGARGFPLGADPQEMPSPNGLNVVLWHQSSRGTAAVHIFNTPATLNPSAGTLHSPPGSCWGGLLRDAAGLPGLACDDVAPDTTASVAPPGWSCSLAQGFVSHYPGSNNFDVYLFHHGDDVAAFTR